MIAWSSVGMCLTLKGKGTTHHNSALTIICWPIKLRYSIYLIMYLRLLLYVHTHRTHLYTVIIHYESTTHKPKQTLTEGSELVEVWATPSLAPKGAPVSSKGMGDTLPEWGNVVSLESAPMLREWGSLRLLLLLLSPFLFFFLPFFFWYARNWEKVQTRTMNNPLWWAVNRI